MSNKGSVISVNISEEKGTVKHPVSEIEIDSLGVTNANITGNSSVGIFVGYTRVANTINNCFTTGVVLGTPDFISPEQIEGRKSSPQTDISPAEASWQVPPPFYPEGQHPPQH